jgi:hypothetical protein
MGEIIRYTLKEIKKQIKEKESKNYWFRITNKGSVLIAKGKTKKETKNIVKDKIKNKPKKYDNQILRYLHIKFIKEDKGVNSGSILVQVNNYQVINNKIKNIYISGKQGPVYFKKKWLNYWGWNKKYLVKISENLRKNKSEINAIGVNIYEVEFDKDK